MVVEFNGKKLIHHGQHADSFGEWTRNSVLVRGTGGMDKVLFRETTTRSGNDGSGPFLDVRTFMEAEIILTIRKECIDGGGGTRRDECLHT